MSSSGLNIKKNIDDIKTYLDGTVQELKKCTWATKDELKQSTVIVVTSVFMLAFFVFVVDKVVQNLLLIGS